MLPLGGCLLTGDKPEPGLDIPPAYERGPRNPVAAEAAVPPLDWWRAFRSRELTEIIEAGARGQSRYRRSGRPHRAGRRAMRASPAPPLLPIVDLNGNASTIAAVQDHRQHERHQRFAIGRQRRHHQQQPDGLAHRQLRDRLLGQEPLRSCARPKRPRSPAATTARWSALPPWSPPPTPISRCWPRRTGCASRAKTLQSATRVLNLIQQRLNAGTASALDTAQQESLVNTQRAAIPPLEQTLRAEPQSRSRC